MKTSYRQGGKCNISRALGTVEFNWPQALQIILGLPYSALKFARQQFFFQAMHNAGCKMKLARLHSVSNYF